MSGNNIIRLNVDSYNTERTPKPLTFNLINTRPFVDDSENYEVYLEKGEVPISKSLPMYLGRKPLKLLLEATDPNNKPQVFGNEKFLEYELGDSFRNIQELLTAINLRLGWEDPYHWCYLSVKDDLITMSTLATGVGFEKVKIWIDGYLEGLFEGLHIGQELVHNNHTYLELVNPKPDNDVTTTQKESRLAKFINIKSFRVYSTLPTEHYWLYDQATNEMLPSTLLGDMTFNSVAMAGNDNLLYIPSAFRFNSLTNAGSISRFSLRFTTYYSCGLELDCVLDKYGYASLTFVFSRKEKV